MAFLRFRLAYIIVAVLRSTALRRVVDGSLDRHRDRHGDTSSSLHPGVNTVRPRPSGSGRSVLTPGPHRLLRSNQARAPLVRRDQEAVRRTDAREVDRPFHIIAGLEAWLIGTGATVDRVGRVCSCDIADRRYRGGCQPEAAKRR